jgi:hypothetical protein
MLPWLWNKLNFLPIINYWLHVLCSYMYWPYWNLHNVTYLNYKQFLTLQKHSWVGVIFKRAFEKLDLTPSVFSKNYRLKIQMRMHIFVEREKDTFFQCTDTTATTRAATTRRQNSSTPRTLVTVTSVISRPAQSYVYSINTIVMLDRFWSISNSFCF